MTNFALLRPWKLPLLAALCAAGMWTYVDRVLIAHQVRYAAAHGVPRGNSSDLYPRWLGARELLLHGRDPYSAEVTREAQAGFYGRSLDPEGGEDRNYQQGFYYPVYVAFLLAPSLNLPFEVVRKSFWWILLGLILATLPLWPRVLKWHLPLWARASLVLFVIGSFPVVQGLKVQNLTLLVFALLAITMTLLASDRPIPAGILLAFATIKPQLVCLLLVWLAIWTLGDWRRRYHWAASFLLTMLVLWGASEWYLPNWIFRFFRALREYHLYTGEISVMDQLIGAPWSRILEFLALAVTLVACWRERRQVVNADGFTSILGLVLAITVLIEPNYRPYNQVLLIPALLILLKDRRGIWQRDAINRVLSVITVGSISWAWGSAGVLTGLSFVLPREMVERGWAVPMWTSFHIPLAVAALMLLHYYQRTFTAPARAGSS